MKKLTGLQLLTAYSLTAFVLLISLTFISTLLIYTLHSQEIFKAEAKTAILFILATTAIFFALLIFATIKVRSIILQLDNSQNRVNTFIECFNVRQDLYEATLTNKTSETVSRIFVNYLNSLARWESVAVYSYDSDEQVAYLLSSHFDSEPLPDLIPLSLIEGFETLASGKTFIQSNEHHSKTPGFSTVKLPLISGNSLIGWIDIVSRYEYDLKHYLTIIKEFVGPLSIVVQNEKLLTSVEKQRQQLRSLSARLTEMEEAERKNIAIELHDRVGQNLSALNINLNIIKSRMKAGLVESAENCITDSFMLVEETTEQIRDIMSDLRPPNLDDHGLVAAIRWYANKHTRRTGLEITVAGDGSAPRLSLEVEMVFFRIAQEALNNILKHAKAHTANVTVENGNHNKLIMKISDDGIGFDTLNITNHQREHTGLGLISMQERISALGGTFSIESTKGKGTNITVEV